MVMLAVNASLTQGMPQGEVETAGNEETHGDDVDVRIGVVQTIRELWDSDVRIVRRFRQGT
jgi:hypothetical protein